MRVVVQHAALFHETVKLGARKHVQRFVKILFHLVEFVLLNDDFQFSNFTSLARSALRVKLHRQ